MKDLSALSRRNMIGAVVVLVAIVVLCVTTLWPEWSDYRSTVVPTEVASVGETATADGQVWKIASVRRVASSSSMGLVDPPAGTSLAVITVSRSGAVNDTGCTGVLTDGLQNWAAEVIAAVPLADGATSLCTQPGPLQLTFAIPHGARLQALDIKAPSGRILVRLEL